MNQSRIPQPRTFVSGILLSLLLPGAVVALACANTEKPATRTEKGQVTPTTSPSSEGEVTTTTSSIDDEVTTTTSDSKEAEVTTTTTQPVKAASTCDRVREALLTGSQADIEGAMSALVGDTSADTTAREYAQYYLGRDRLEPTLRQMDVDLVRMSCLTF